MIERTILRNGHAAQPLRLESAPAAASGIALGHVRRLAYCVMMLGVPLAGLGLADPVRRVEPFVAGRVAELFVYAVVRNDPDRIGRAVAAVKFAHVDAAQLRGSR